MTVVAFVIGLWLGNWLAHRGEPETLEQRRLSVLDDERRPQCMPEEAYG